MAAELEVKLIYISNKIYNLFLIFFHIYQLKQHYFFLNYIKI